ncbi:hypothetical protein L3073_14165 [Ancylomarina sp. DW003]|nr:hypothetical protein [Ancylomarina sp. DW003]MDE5423361.1 hypothetical protein [Ancylomarina sp. DW003]
MTKVSLSWLNLKPNQDIYGNQEYYSEYIIRIRETFDEFAHIPDTVFEQWLWAHHNNYETLRNYAWINYEEVEFVLSNWTNEQLSSINVINEYTDYVKGRARCTEIKDFCCIEDDLNSWMNNGTWRTPPIILDVSSIEEEIPTWSEIKSPFQLVEGHSRVGYLKSMIILEKLGKVKVASNHPVYIMKIKQPQEDILGHQESTTIQLANISLTAEEVKRISDELEKEF